MLALRLSTYRLSSRSTPLKAMCRSLPHLEIPEESEVTNPVVRILPMWTSQEALEAASAIASTQFYFWEDWLPKRSKNDFRGITMSRNKADMRLFPLFISFIHSARITLLL